MRKTALTLVTVLLALSPAWALAAAPVRSDNRSAVVPGRPAAMTTAQFAAIRQLEAAPQHARVQGLSASYASERERSLALTRASDDFWTAVYDVGWPGSFLAIAICAL